MYIKSVCAHMCLCLCMCSVSAGFLGGQKEVLNALVLDLQAGVSHLMWWQFGPSARAVVLLTLTHFSNALCGFLVSSGYTHIMSQ